MNSKAIRFTVFGTPKPKAMPRVVKNKTTGKVHSFKPQRSANWELSISGQSLQYKPEVPFKGPVALGCLFYRPILKSFNKKKTELARDLKIFPVSKPDIKNLIANVEDALNELFWIDDSQVVQWVDVDGLPTGKYYSDTPRIEIVVIPLDPDNEL